MSDLFPDNANVFRPDERFGIFIKPLAPFGFPIKPFIAQTLIIVIILL
jgi:hypothetical protein